MKHLKIMFMSVCTIMCGGVAFSDISAGVSTANCDASDIGATSTNTRLRADWTPNTIDLTWYTSTGVNVSGTNMCTYDNAITVPTNPTKTGYTFGGWRARTQLDFSTLPTNTNGNYSWSKDTSAKCRVIRETGTNTNSACTNSAFNDLDNLTWKTRFPDGSYVYGKSGCFTTAVTALYDTLSNTSGNGRNCMCKLTSYIPANSNTIYTPAVAYWVFSGYNNSTYNYCILQCAVNCAKKFQTDSNFRTISYSMFDLATLDTSTNANWDAQHARWKEFDEANGDYTMQNEFGTTDNSDLNDGEWAITFDYGTVYGKSLCTSSSLPDYYSTGTPNESASGPNCWCKVTQFKTTSGNILTAVSNPWSWYNNMIYDGEDHCERECASSCASGVAGNADNRTALYGQSQ